jgi:hypothetical protein
MLSISVALSTQSLSAQNRDRGVRNIVLVHGAWADGSGWKGVYDILVKDGYKVSLVQEPETSFQEDVSATKRLLALRLASQGGCSSDRRSCIASSVEKDVKGTL